MKQEIGERQKIRDGHENQEIRDRKVIREREEGEETGENKDSNAEAGKENPAIL